MRFVIGSSFRNSSHAHIARWVTQCLALRSELREHYYCGVRAIAVEGDSIDDTPERLVRTAAEYGLDLELVRCHHGGPVFGSTEAPSRMSALSKVGNAILDAVKDTDDILLYVESDLIWTPDDVMPLIHFATGRDSAPFQVFAPLTMAGDLLYDIWATRDLAGLRYSPFTPFHPDVAKGLMTEVGSVGSCLVIPGWLARDKWARMSEGALVEWCGRVRALGHRIAVHPGCRIQHPV